MPLLKLGEKRYYLGIFFKVLNFCITLYRAIIGINMRYISGELVQSVAVLPIPWDAFGEYHVAGGERPAGEAHQGLWSWPRAFLDVGNRSGGRGQLLLDVQRSACHL